MIDFDEKFHKYYEKWIKNNSGKYTVEELEDKISEVYEQWLNSKDKELLGKTPSEWVNSLSNEQLTTIFIESFNGGNDPASLIVDAVEDRPECIKFLKDALISSYDDEIKMHAANMLQETDNVQDCLIDFVHWICDDKSSTELKDVAVEILKEYRDNTVRDKLFAELNSADEAKKTLIAEILINYEHDERTYKLLCELFESKKNTALYAGYIGKYGDDRAAAMLYKALDDCNYLDFTEIRNAIEILGGVVDDEYRDFSDDEYYKAIKNIK